MTKLPALVCALAAMAGCETMYQAPPQTPAATEVEPPTEVEVVPDPRVETIAPVEFAKPPDVTPAVAPVEPRFAPPPRKRVQRAAPAPTQDPPCPACGMG